MPEYQYASKDLAGKLYRGSLEAENLDGFYRLLKERGQFCIDVREAGLQSRAVSLGGGKIRLRDLSVFCRQFSTMLSSGLPVIKCLDILYEQTANKRLKVIILGVYESVQRGDSLSGAMKSQKVFPLLFLHMVEAGEASGTLDTVMKRLAEQFEKDYKTRNKVTQALIYPAFLICLTVVVVVVLLTFVLPTFLNMFSQFGGTLPVTTRILLAVSHALTNYWYVFLAAIVLIVILWNMFLKSPAGRLKWDRFKLRMPILGKTVLVLESSRFARTLASLFSSGMPVIQSIEVVARVINNRYIQESLNRANEDVRRGVSISAAIRKLGIFPTMLCSMLSIGEESGNMEEILNKSAAFYDEQSDTAIQKMIALLEPVMIVALAVIVGFIIISIITPIYSIYSQIGQSGGT